MIKFQSSQLLYTIPQACLKFSGEEPHKSTHKILLEAPQEVIITVLIK